MAKKNKIFNVTLYKKIIKRRKTAFIVSMCNVIVLLLFSYLINNQALFTGEDLNQFAWMEWIKDKYNLSKSLEGKDDAVFVNVAFDKQLVDRNDKYGMTIGNVDITDRVKLKLFLAMLQRTNTYKYIFLDVRFEKGFESPNDFELISQIVSMRNIVVANHSDIEILDSTLLSKVALSDYSSTITGTNFTRYEYVKNGQVSVPLFAYHDLTGNTINSHVLFYTSNLRLCYKCLFVNFPVEDWCEFNEYHYKNYYNMGSDLLDNYSDKDLAMLTKGKYVVIGDMVEDIHDTYSGQKPGPVITYYAFIALMNGNHYVRYGLILFLGLMYFIISMSLFESYSFWESLPFIKKSKSKFVHFCATLIGYSFILLLVMVALNLLFGIATSIMLPSIYFSIQKTYINYKKQMV